MRIPKHIISFVQDSDPEVRHEAMLIFYEISWGLLDWDTEVEGTDVGTEDAQDLNKWSKTKSAFSQHKNLSMSAYYGGDAAENKEPVQNKKDTDKSQADISQKKMSYINRTTNLTT